MKVKYEKVTREIVEVEVSFPVYSKHDMGGDDYDVVAYRRFEESGREVTITERSSYGRRSTEWEIEIEHRATDYKSFGDYSLGRGKFESSKEEFEQKLAQLNEFVKSL